MSLWQWLFGSAPPATIATTRPQRPRRQPVGPSPPSDATDTTSPVVLDGLGETFHRFVFALPPPAPDAVANTGTAMLKRLELLSTRFDMRSLPRLPTVLPQLLRTLKSDTAAGRELARLVGRDPLMVGEVMRVTGSVYYRSAQPVSSLRQAVVLLGQDGLRRIITQHAMKPILQTNAGALGHAGEYLWEHAERCAHVCAWLVKHRGGDNFEAYLAGIVCHAGTGAVVRLLTRLLADVPPPGMDSSFVRACAALAARLSYQAAEHWQLSSRVLTALEERQHPETPAASTLGQSLVVADAMAMAHLLGQHGLLDAHADLSGLWPDQFAAPLLRRCQDDLRQRFRTGALEMTAVTT